MKTTPVTKSVPAKTKENISVLSDEERAMFVACLAAAKHEMTEGSGAP